MQNSLEFLSLALDAFFGSASLSTVLFLRAIQLKIFSIEPASGKEKIPAVLESIARRNGEADRAGRRLFEGPEQLFARRAKLITKDKDRLVQICHWITHWPDFGNLNWNQLTAEAQKAWNRAAQMIG